MVPASRGASIPGGGIVPSTTLSQTAAQLTKLATGMCFDVTNFLISRGYFLKLNHIGLILQESYMASLCILSLTSGGTSDSAETDELISETKEPIRDWLVSVYAATNRDYDYDVLVTNVVENLQSYYHHWCDQMTGGEEPMDCKEIGKWAPAATAACVKNISYELEQDLDITLSHEIGELNDIIYKHIGGIK